jgi:hypothetical protein
MSNLLLALVHYNCGQFTTFSEPEPHHTRYMQEEYQNLKDMFQQQQQAYALSCVVE